MYILDLIPLAFIPKSQSQVLSYFHSQPLPIGSVVEVNLNRRQVKGIVIGFDTIKKRKLDFKKNVDFELKNVSKVLGPELQVEKWQLDIAGYLSNYYYAPLGVSLRTVLPPFWGKKGYSETRKPKVENGKREDIKAKFIYTDLFNHYQDYEKEIERQTTGGKQVFLMVAENTAAKYFLERYMSLNPEFISSGISNKKYYELWQKIRNIETKLIIGTRVGLFLPFQNLGLIIVDDESNEAYKSEMTPRYHAADLAHEIARIHEAEIISSAVVPRLETHYFQKLKTVNSRLQPKADISVVNMTDEIKAGNFSIFSRDLKNLLTNNLILFIPRRGHANFVYCRDCGQTLICPNCSVSLAVHQPNDPRYALQDMNLVCHHCNFSQPQPKKCPHCRGYSLKAYGIGIEKVEAELKKFYKFQNLETPKIFRLDSDRIKTPAREVEVIERFLTQSSVLLTTQMIFSHKYNELLKNTEIGIISADSLINIPDFRAEESLFRQLYTLSKMGGNMVIQTYRPEQTAVKLAADGRINDFFEGELKNRKEFNYPPFSRLIKLTHLHRDQTRAKRESMIIAEKLRTAIKQLAAAPKIEIIGPSPAFIYKERGQYLWNIILKIIESEEIKKRNELLRLVPAGWLIDVNPRNII